MTAREQESSRMIFQPTVKDRPETWAIVVKTLSELEPFVERWDDLAENAIEKNPFYEPWYVLPYLKTYEKHQAPQFVLVLSGGTETDRASGVLCGVFPLQKKFAPFCGIPIPALGLWKHEYCFLCTPLIRKQYEKPCISTFFDWLLSNRSVRSLVEFDFIPGEGPFVQLLHEELRRRRLKPFVADSYCRALLKRSSSASTYKKEALSSKTQSMLRRKEKRLSELGELEIVELPPRDDIDVWIEDFLKLEASGWKGAAGSAILSRAEDRNFFVEVLRKAFQLGRLKMLGIHLHKKPVALMCSFISGEGLYCYKIAFDEHYSKYSPGVLMQLRNIELFHEMKKIAWMDSCASRHSVLFNRMWKDRRSIQTLMFPRRWPGTLALVVRRLARYLLSLVRRNREGLSLNPCSWSISDE